MDPLGMDWTQATADAYHERLKVAIHVFNHDLRSTQAVDRTLCFAIGRARWFQRHLPSGSRQGARFDDRGQNLPEATKARLREVLAPCFSSVVFTSETPA